MRKICDVILVALPSIYDIKHVVSKGYLRPSGNIFWNRVTKWSLESFPFGHSSLNLNRVHLGMPKPDRCSEPLKPAHHLVLWELCSLLAEEHVVGPEVAPRVHVLGCQLQQCVTACSALSLLSYPVHWIVHNIQDQRLIRATKLKIWLSEPEIS